MSGNGPALPFRYQPVPERVRGATLEAVDLSPRTAVEFSVQIHRTSLPRRRGGDPAFPRGLLQLAGCDFPSQHQTTSLRVTGHPSQPGGGVWEGRKNSKVAPLRLTSGLGALPESGSKHGKTNPVLSVKKFPFKSEKVIKLRSLGSGGGLRVWEKNPGGWSAQGNGFSESPPHPCILLHGERRVAS